MPSDGFVELVLKLRPELTARCPDYASLQSTLRDLGIATEDSAAESPSPLDSYRTLIVPRDVASRAVDALKGNAALEGAYVKPRGETP